MSRWFSKLAYSAVPDRIIQIERAGRIFSGEWWCETGMLHVRSAYGVRVERLQSPAHAGSRARTLLADIVEPWALAPRPQPVRRLVDEDLSS